MDMTQIDEQWVDIPRVQNQKNAIIAISNTGKYRKLDGTIGVLKIRKRVMYCSKYQHCSRIIAENFLITVRRSDQVFVDHITHTPTEYNVNDVRNLRWCTKAENNGFEEARENMSKSLKGEKAPAWKGDDVGPSGACQRAKKLYKEGKITKEEFQPYRDGWNEYRRQRKIARKTSDPILCHS
jgi:hypothetical protein